MLCILVISSATDSLNTSQYLRDGFDETIVSAAGRFELGFFSPGNSTKRYVGIWFKKVSEKTVVWVANRGSPIVNSSGVLRVTDRGILVLLERNNTTVWSTNSSRLVQNPIAQLLDSGNLVVRDRYDSHPKNLLWQSFDYPCDTIIPGFKQGRDLVTGLDRYLSSWKSNDDPSPGDFTYRLELSGYPQFVARKGSVEQFRGGSWNGKSFTRLPGLKPNPLYTYRFNFNEKEISLVYNLLNNSTISRVELNQDGILRHFLWINQTQSWYVYLTFPVDNCDTYALCGAHGSCNIKSSAKISQRVEPIL